MDKKQKRTETIPVRVTKKEKEEILKLADEMGTNVSTVLRMSYKKVARNEYGHKD